MRMMTMPVQLASDGNGWVENNTEYMNIEEQEGVEIGNGENENCDLVYQAI